MRKKRNDRRFTATYCMDSGVIIVEKKQKNYNKK